MPRLNARFRLPLRVHVLVLPDCGEAGLLDGRAATTHWAFQEQLSRRYPRAEVLPQAILVDQGRVITAGGATSFLNLALHIVERVFGVEVARASSKMFLIDVNKAPQSAYAMFSSQKLHEDRAILRAQSMIERYPERAPRVDRLARGVALHCGGSEVPSIPAKSRGRRIGPTGNAIPEGVVNMPA